MQVDLPSDCDFPALPDWQAASNLPAHVVLGAAPIVLVHLQPSSIFIFFGLLSPFSQKRKRKKFVDDVECFQFCRNLSKRLQKCNLKVANHKKIGMFRKATSVIGRTSTNRFCVSRRSCSQCAAYRLFCVRNIFVEIMSANRS